MTGKSCNTIENPSSDLSQARTSWIFTRGYRKTDGDTNWEENDQILYDWSYKTLMVSQTTQREKSSWTPYTHSRSKMTLIY